MKCTSCGAELYAGTQACPICGLAVRTLGTESKAPVLLAVLIAFAGAFILAGAVVTLVFLNFRTRFRANSFYQESLAIARSSSEIRSVLGQPVEEGWFTFGTVQHVYGSDFAEWIASLKGPRGSGRLHGAANRIGPSWRYSRLLFISGGNDTAVDITTPPPKDALLAAESKKRVFLIPLGPVRKELLAWAPAYYKAKFGLDAEILPEISLDASVWNGRRRQLTAEKLITLMKRALPEKVEDQLTILVGVTSEDMYIGSYDWRYAINYREDGRFGVVSTARLQPSLFFQKWNQALAVSRLQKMITKNVYLLCFDVPMSSDYTSAVSGGVMSPEEVDYMSDEIIGAENRWHSLSLDVVPTISVVLTPNQPAAWSMEWSAKPPADISSEYFAANLWAGLLIQRRTDFYLDGDFPLQFVRTYASKDEQSREFGVGTNDSLDISMSGEPGKYLQLTLENGVRTHFERNARMENGRGQIYQGRADYFSPFSQGTLLMRGYDIDLETIDGWHYFFPYLPTAKAEEKFSVLTGYSDPQGKRFEMQRNADGDLLRVTTPAGKWLHFEPDDKHRFRRIEDSEGRFVNYGYDSRGDLVRVSDSQGNTEAYRYDDNGQMVAVLDGQNHVQMSVTYSPDGGITGQTLADGRTFQYAYLRGSAGKLFEIRLSDPRGYVTLFDYVGEQYLQSLPSRNPDAINGAPEPFLE